MYENDHFNQAQAEFKKVLNGQSKQAQAEFKKVLNGQSKHAAQKKRGKKWEEKEGESGSSMGQRLPFYFLHCPSFTTGCNDFMETNILIKAFTK